LDGTFFGSSGTSGVSGSSGTSGESGSAGTSGVSGTNGTTGSAGTSGFDGTFFGSSGVSGTSGTSGQSGSSGTSGLGTNGTTGSSGTSGKDGTLFGSSGTSGTSGESGSSGTSGLGTSGTSGTSGKDGTLFGSSGTSGLSGTSGESGTSGTSGLGTSGTSGTSGKDGTSGFMSLAGTTENGVITWQNTPSTGVVESNLTFDGTTLSVAGNVASTTFRETYSNLGTGGSITIDLSTANNFRRQFNATATVTLSNAPASNAFGFTLVAVNAGAYVITWPVNVDWAGGSAPILTSSGVDVLVFYTFDNGTTYLGFVAGKNLN
jgi:hypothetical protein